MTDATSNSNPASRAEVKWESRWIPMPPEGTPEGEMEETPENETGVSFLKVWDCFVDVVRPGCERIRFRVNRRKDRRLTFTDRREALTGTAGTTGIWGTRPAARGQAPRLDTDRFQDGSGAADRSGAGRGDRPGASGRMRDFFWSRQLHLSDTRCRSRE